MKKGIMIVMSAPSGCGKGTILGEVMKRGDFFYSVSATTRQPRPGEKDGVNYRFMSREQFEGMINGGDMLEYAEYCGNYYGTPADAVMNAINNGRDAILEIEVQGAAKIRKICPEAVFVFILPPSIDVLKKRLSGRGTETEEVINSRVAQAVNEIRQAHLYDYIIVNDDLDTAVNDFMSVITAAKNAVSRNGSLISGLLDEKEVSP